MLRRSGPASNWANALDRDYFPGFDPYLRWLRTPLGSLGLAAVAAGLCGMILHPRGFVILFAILAVIVVGFDWPWLTVLGLRGVLGFDRNRAREGDSVGVMFRVRNLLPWGAWGLSVEGGFLAQARPAGDRSAVLGIASAPGWRTAEASWKFVPECRGEYPLRPPRLSSGFPFGLYHASRDLAVSSRLLVWPRTFAVGPIPEVPGRGSEGLVPRQAPGTSGDVTEVRHYRRGDSLRRIHWPQTARQGRLVVCERQSLAAPRVQVVLDTHRDAHEGDGPRGSREWAIRVAASVFEDWTNRGAEVDLVVQGRVVPAQGASVPARRARGLDALARVEPDDLLALADLLDLPACRQFSGGLRLVVTTDLGLRRVPGRPGRGPRELFVVLKASAFAGAEGEGRDPGPLSLPIRPWIWVDDPSRVSQCIRLAWKEAAVVG